MNPTINAGLQIIGVSAVSGAIIEVQKGNNLGGIILALIGIISYLVYEYTPVSK